ncbi:MAG: c-type cytochrome domain-containing protein [Rubripirellula sp.]
MNPLQKRMVKAINASVLQAGVRFKAGEYEAAGEKIREAMGQIETATKDGSPELFDAIEPAMARIAKAHTLLEFEGVALPPFRRPTRPAAEPAMATPAKPKPKPTKPAPTPTPPTAGISFTKVIAPILANRCGRCHAADSKGGFNLASYQALMKGPPEGVVIFAGDTIGSRLIETIETGDMPRGGGKVSAQELQTLKAWIVAGAKFDGQDPSMTIAGSTPMATGNAPRPAVKRATGNETVSFAADVAPLLVDNCNGCHIDAMQVRGGLRMDSFAQLFRGGDSGAVIMPGKGEQSLLVQKLRGTVGEQMPAGGRPALSEDSIKLISTWIDEGATLDGASENQPLRVMSQLAWAAAATPEQISERRQELAEKNLKLVVASGGDISTKTTDHFFVIGSSAAGTIELVAEQAELQMKKVGTVVSGKAGEAFFKGRATIFVLPRRYDYSEFAKMVESRGVPSEWTSHWKFDGIDAYVSMVATDRDEEEEIVSRMTAPLISLAVSTRGGDVPRWLAEGVGVTAAKRGSKSSSKNASRDRQARQRADAETSQALAAMGNAKQFLEGKLTPEHTDRIGAAIASSMLGSYRRNYDNLLRNLQKGQPFNQAFFAAFRATPIEFVQSWVQWATAG